MQKMIPVTTLHENNGKSMMSYSCTHKTMVHSQMATQCYMTLASDNTAYLLYLQAVNFY